MAERALVVGAAGLIGNALVRAWERRGATVLGADHDCLPGGPIMPLDAARPGALAEVLREFKPGVVAFPAANPHVDYCEAHPAESRRVNVEAAVAAAEETCAAGGRFVFFSSDYVFDGERPSYGEDDPPNPLNEYGRQKAEVEAAVLALPGRHLVVRTSGVYGWQWRPKNFVLQVLAALGEGRELDVPHDLRYNPTYAENLAEVTADLARGPEGGIFHVVGADRVDRFGFAQEIAAAFGLDASLLRPAPSSRAKAGAPRPKESSLRTDRVRRLAATPLWGVKEGLADMRGRRGQWLAYAAVSLPRLNPNVV